MKRRGFLKAFLATTILIGAFRDLAPAPIELDRREELMSEIYAMQIWDEAPPPTHILVHPKVMKLLEAMG